MYLCASVSVVCVCVCVSLCVYMYTCLGVCVGVWAWIVRAQVMCVLRALPALTEKRDNRPQVKEKVMHAALTEQIIPPNVMSGWMT